MTNKINKCDGNHGGPRFADPECWNDAPAPPAGGEACDICHGSGVLPGLTKALTKCSYCGNGWRTIAQAEAELRLIDQKEVTRLQAEVERLTRKCQNADLALRYQTSNYERVRSELTKALELLKEADDFMYIMTGNDTQRDLDAKYGRLLWEDAIVNLRGEIAAALNQSAPADKAPLLIQALHANGDRIAMEATIAQQAQRIADLEADKGHGEPVAEIVSKFGDPEAFGERELIALKDISKFPYGTKLYAEQPAPVAVVMPEKYDDALLPFLSLMRAELHANARKGDRPGWLQMDRKTAVLEVFYHMGKLHMAVHRNDKACITEYAADVANMCMMLTDVCGCLNSEPKP